MNRAQIDAVTAAIDETLAAGDPALKKDAFSRREFAGVLAAAVETALAESPARMFVTKDGLLGVTIYPRTGDVTIAQRLSTGDVWGPPQKMEA